MDFKLDCCTWIVNSEVIYVCVSMEKKILMWMGVGRYNGRKVSNK